MCHSCDFSRGNSSEISTVILSIPPKIFYETSYTTTACSMNLSIVLASLAVLTFIR